MKHFVFVGHYVFGIGPAEVSGLLARIRDSNQRHGLTGALLYDDGNIMQIIEGPDDEVDAVRSKLRVDPRLGDIIDLHLGQSEVRMFPDWPMASGPCALQLSANWTPVHGHQGADPSNVVKDLPEMIAGLMLSFDSRRRSFGLYPR